ncbi:hemerythrin domain-containing protein [Vibrio sp. SCSIO 43137]|uniref:hemerythrin domain-containing protein n=1 Tax=Vibrio sp. SCSIO 43137 TaxID=3021011 RepID=UPI00230718C7|nr:hemerythrin domain-containing protein [Vibrio sp. SCSIO 43137]WCE30210.1 hemerythrin domain-containing protein [Vibrio sp. SCSIO 43137]
MMLEQIHREHGYMVRLLAILRKKWHCIKEEEPINYSLVREIVDYLSSHSETVHHPKEDILYRHFSEQYPDSGQVKNLEQEHILLSRKTKEFLLTVDMILQDAVVPLDVFADQLEQFILAQKQHLDLEEREILPLIKKAFTTEDWQKVESLWTQSDEDPVFGDTIADQYKQLAQRVRQTETEAV